MHDPSRLKECVYVQQTTQGPLRELVGGERHNGPIELLSSALVRQTQKEDNGGTPPARVSHNRCRDADEEEREDRQQGRQEEASGWGGVEALSDS